MQPGSGPGEWKPKVFGVDEAGFEPLALEIFRYQYDQNSLYQQYVDALGLDISQIVRLEQIPFLPIRFFKSHEVVTGEFEARAVFESSGTTGMVNSRHLVRDIELYRESFTRAFKNFYGDPKEYCVIGLLPSYLERQHSSLVFMVDRLIKASGHPDSGFYLQHHEKLIGVLDRLEAAGQKTLLIGVTFALLDLAKDFQLPLRHTIVMETGGMKGRRKEMVRAEVHALLKEAWQLPAIHSEYGMTELLSQAYSKGGGIFRTPPWMRVLLRDEEDPFSVSRAAAGRKDMAGAINIIDLANVHSCSFLATDDAGRLYADDSFEVLGRMDNTDLRGCSLLVASEG